MSIFAGMLNPRPVELSIVIVSYNVQDLLLKCLYSLQNYVSKNLITEIIVVDNHSNDSTCTKIKELFPEVRLIENKSNAGFSAANNQGFKLAAGRFIFMLNPDTELVDRSIESAIEFLAKHQQKQVLLGPRLMYPNRNSQVSAWKFPQLANHLLELFFLSNWIDLCSYGNLKQTSEVDAVSGAAILMSKETLNKLEGLDEYLFWMDDTDLCKRNNEKGGMTVYFPEFQVIHHIGQSAKRNWNIVIANQIISKLKYYKKHRQYLAFYISSLLFFLQIISRVIIFALLGFFSVQYKEKNKAYSYTFKRYFKYLFFNFQEIQ